MELVTDAAATLVALHAPLDVRSTAEVREVLYAALPHHDLVLDLTDCEWIDGAALRMLTVATLLAHRSGHHLVLRGCAPRVRRVLHRSHLRPRLEVEPVLSA